jgi:hypothetical protein
MLKVVYALFLGLILAAFVGVGIATFYQAPKYPEYPIELEKLNPSNEFSPEEKVIDQKSRDDQKKYQADFSVYNRNTSIVVMAFALFFLALGLLLAHRIDVLADGFVLGGIFSLLYSIGRGFASEDLAYRFIVISVSLVLALALGYIKFIKPATAKA